MAGELQNLAVIFNNRIFRVPDYQRGYAWEEPQLTDFWDDLHRLDERRKHYTGQLTLEAVPESDWTGWDEDTWLIEKGGYRPYYVVDGQQRLTTAIILIQCLLARIRDDQQFVFLDKSDHVKRYLLQKFSGSRAYIFGYQKDDPSYEFFKTQILTQPATGYEGVETSYTANLLRARDFFTNRLNDVHIEDLERWFRALTQRFVFNLNELVDELDVFVVFETMNNRGKQLSTLELLKNQLIYLSTLLPTDDIKRRVLRSSVNNAWRTVFKFLGKEKDHPLDDDDFLWAHWAMYFAYERAEANALRRFLLTKEFTVQNVESGRVEATSLQQYVESLQQSVQKWHEIWFPHRASSLKPKVCEGLRRLNMLDRGAFEPLLLAAFQVSDDENELTRLLQAMERFIFLVHRLCGARKDTGDYQFYRLAHRVFERERTIPEAMREIQRRTDELFTNQKAIDEMRELFRDGAGFYDWDGLKYFLFEYEQWLKEQARGEESKVEWDEFKRPEGNQTTVEHIYPQTAKKDDWSSFCQRSKKEREVLLNSLGNLLALSRARNSSFSNRAFREKKQDAEGVTGYFNGSYSEIKVAQLLDWTPETVLKRGMEMVRFLESRWDISFEGRKERLQFLNLEFMEDA